MSKLEINIIFLKISTIIIFCKEKVMKLTQ